MTTEGLGRLHVLGQSSDKLLISLVVFSYKAMAMLLKMMKRLISITFYILLFSCYLDKKYVINGTINKNFGKVYLINYEETRIIDSTEIENGKFYFSSNVNEPDCIKLAVSKSPYRNSFFVENVDFKINIIDADTSYYFDAQGGKLQSLFNDYGKIYDSRRGLIHEIRSGYKEEKTELLSKKYDSVYDEINREVDFFLKKNIDSEISPFIVLFSKRDLSWVKKWYDCMNDDIKSSLGGRRLLKKIDKLSKDVKVGDNFPSYALPDITGRDVSISEIYKNQSLTLIDFWASWCKPCREQHPKLIDLYKKYKDINFTIVSVSLDKQDSIWKKAIKEDNLEWVQLSDSSGNLGKLLNIRSIPFNLLVENSGNIVAKNITTKDLQVKLNDFIE